MAAPEDQIKFAFSFYSEKAWDNSEIDPYEVVNWTVTLREGQVATPKFVAYLVKAGTRGAIKHRVRQLREYTWYSPQGNEYAEDDVFLRGTSYEIDIFLEGKDDCEGVPPPPPAKKKAAPAPAAAAPVPVWVAAPAPAPTREAGGSRGTAPMPTRALATAVRGILISNSSDTDAAIAAILHEVAREDKDLVTKAALLSLISKEDPSLKLLAKILAIV